MFLDMVTKELYHQDACEIDLSEALWLILRWLLSLKWLRCLILPTPSSTRRPTSLDLRVSLLWLVDCGDIDKASAQIGDWAIAGVLLAQPQVLTLDGWERRFICFATPNCPFGFRETDGCIYLHGDASRWVTGTNLFVDGGFSARWIKKVQ